MFNRLLNSKLMLGTVSRLSPSVLIPIFSNRNENDEDQLNNSDSPLPKTGWDRVKAMYSKNEFDEISIELHNVSQATLTGCFIGGCIGGFIKSREAYLYFIENNQAEIFNSTFEAKKKLQDYVTVAFGKGVWRWGWRLGVFTGMFSLVSTTVSVYRNQSSLADYVTAGALAGAVYKANLGPTAMLVGGVLGGILSTIGGIIIIVLLKVTGVSMSDVRRSFYKIREAREEQFNQAVDKSSKEKHDALTMHHDQVVEDRGVKKIDELS